MKKSLIYPQLCWGLFIVYSSFCFSQTANMRNSHGGINNPMQVAGSIVCNSGYVAGTTMNLNFTISTTNVDGEYIDSLAIIFPAGFTIMSTSANPEFPSADTTGGPEHFNGIYNSRQTISWGSNINNTDSFGGIWANPPQTFSIKVSIASGVTGNQIATFFAHGDSYPHTLGDTTSGNLSGTITLSPPAPIDLGAIAATAINGCASTSTTSVSFKFWNVGTSAQSNFSLGYVVNGGTVVTETYTPILNPNDTALYNFATPIAMVADSIYTIQVFTALSGDANIHNDTISTISYTSHNVPYSTGFEASPHDLLGLTTQHISGTGATWTINSDVPHAGTYSAYLFSGVTGASDDWLFSPCINLIAGPTYQVKFYSMKYTDPSYSAHLKLWLNSGTAIADTTKLLLAIDTVKAGTSSPAYQLDSVLFTVPSAGTYILAFEGKNTDTTKKVSLLLDDISIANLGYAGINQLIVNSEQITVYPNPASTIINLQISQFDNERESSIEIYNMIGDCVHRQIIKSTSSLIDIGNLPNGVYILQIRQNNTLTIKKIVKTHTCP
ncbi:MAG: T9SS type A sorting domain-containing protein [Bacteroidia bacterium]